jgi:tripartite-type tricarboxylate transporter receptor subunit TctC
LSSAKLHALAVTTTTRIAPLPDVPTVAEFGYNGYQLDFWLGLFAPPKTSKETISHLAVWFTAAVQASEVRAKLVAQGLYPSVSCGADFAAFLRIQNDEFTRIIREMDIKAE